MADIDGSELSAEEFLLQAHRREKKSLQADVQKLKHSVTKGDKKKKKEVADQIAKLEADLADKHKKELTELESQPVQVDKAEVENIVDGMEELTTTSKDEPVSKAAKKPSKAQKRRNKKASQANEREERIQQQEIDNLTSSRHLEAVNIKSILARRNLQIHEIPSDGNCLYAALAHQLCQREVKDSHESLRTRTADYMRQHQDDFLPFLAKDNGDPYTEDDFTEYCDLTANTPAWGGQLEIQALSHILKVPIEVVQSEGPAVKVGEEFDGTPLVLTYYRHAYGLGEHYHSVEDLVEDKEEEFT